MGLHLISACADTDVLVSQGSFTHERSLSEERTERVEKKAIPIAVIVESLFHWLHRWAHRLLSQEALLLGETCQSNASGHTESANCRRGPADAMST